MPKFAIRISEKVGIKPLNIVQCKQPGLTKIRIQSLLVLIFLAAIMVPGKIAYTYTDVSQSASTAIEKAFHADASNQDPENYQNALQAFNEAVLYAQADNDVKATELFTQSLISARTALWNTQEKATLAALENTQNLIRQAEDEKVDKILPGEFSDIEFDFDDIQRNITQAQDTYASLSQDLGQTQELSSLSQAINTLDQAESSLISLAERINNAITEAQNKYAEASRALENARDAFQSLDSYDILNEFFEEDEEQLRSIIQSAENALLEYELQSCIEKSNRLIDFADRIKQRIEDYYNEVEQAMETTSNAIQSRVEQVSD